LELEKIIPPSDYVCYRLVRFHPHQFFQKYLKNNLYDLVIGLGDYHGPLSRIRLETRAKNVYGDKEIYPFSPIYLDLSLPVVDNLDSRFFQIAANMGTYNCNWLAYSLELLIQQKHLSTRQLFFHLPQKSNAADLAGNIRDLLQINQLI